MRRMILFVLALLLALPAIAGPACAAPPMNTTNAHHVGHGDTHRQTGDHESDNAVHGCIGCAAPTRTGEDAAAPIAIAAPLFLLRPDLPLTGRARHPETPPPRLTA